MKKNPKSHLQTLDPLEFQHGTQRSRRDLLGQGIISLGASLAAPSLLSLVSKNAYAQSDQSCQSSESQESMLPFLCIDLGGGANLAGANVIVGGPGGQKDFLASWL